MLAKKLLYGQPVDNQIGPLYRKGNYAIAFSTLNIIVFKIWEYCNKMRSFDLDEAEVKERSHKLRQTIARNDEDSDYEIKIKYLLGELENIRLVVRSFMQYLRVQ